MNVFAQKITFYKNSGYLSQKKDNFAMIVTDLVIHIQNFLFSASASLAFLPARV